MKKFLAILLACMLLLICFVGCSKEDEGGDEDATLTAAPDQVYNGFAYDTNEDGNYSIIGYQIESESVVTIPEEINGRPVTGIDSGAFKANKMSGIVIPSSVTYIADTAFYDCDNLTSVVIPDSVETLGNNLFDNCDKLTSVTLPAALEEIPAYMFMNCVALTSVNIPSTITVIGAGAFYGCEALATVAIPTGLTAMGDGAFYGCNALSELTLPAGMKAENIGKALISSSANTTLVVTAGSDAEAYAIQAEYSYRVAD